MKKFFAALCLSLPLTMLSQNSIVQEGEFGFGLGAGHYFGDLNTRAKLNRPKLAAGLWERSQALTGTTFPFDTLTGSG